MTTAKLFANGQSQAVRLPKEYRFSGSEVYIKKIGDAIILFPKGKEWDMFLDGLAGFSDDFMENGRNQDQSQERESF
ncbi:MAG: antitoxin [Clostridiales Family XIII bacterium]|nr:antitoxin [Clostridiales Family XIII bacterium]